MRFAESSFWEEVPLSLWERGQGVRGDMCCNLCSLI